MARKRNLSCEQTPRGRASAPGPACPRVRVRVRVRLAPVSPFSIVPEGPIAWRQALPERGWFVSQNLNNF